MLAVWRENDKKWTEAERSQVQTIATSLALAVVLDQRNQWQEAVQAESLRKMLSETLHQVRGCSVQSMPQANAGICKQASLHAQEA